MTTSHDVRLYPCDRGMGGLGVGYHDFIVSWGAVVCRLCGKRPPAEPLKITCESIAISATPQQGTMVGGLITEGHVGQHFEAVRDA